LLSRFVDWNPVRRSGAGDDGREVTMTDRVTTIRDELTPIVESLDLSVYDITLTGGDRPTLAVLLDRAGSEHGVDLDALETATRTISAALDAMDPVHGRYLLEVSSPGLERPLRTAAHFAGAVGEIVTCKTRDARATWPGCAESWPPPTATRSPSPRMQAPRMRATTRLRSTPSTRRAPCSSGDPHPSRQGLASRRKKEVAAQ